MDGPRRFCIVGAPEPVDPADASHMERVWRGVKDLNEAYSDGEYHLIPIKVVSAHLQMVSGRLWIYEVLVGESKSRRATVAVSQLSEDNCKLKRGGIRSLFKIELWEQLWLIFEQFTVEKIRNVAINEQI